MFKLISKLAWNNAFLRMGRTILVITMIAVSMALMLWLQGIYDGMTMNMIDKTLRSDSGEVSLFHKEYRLNPVIQNRIEDADKIIEQLHKDPEISSVVKRFSIGGLASTARKSSFAKIIGIDLDDEERFGQFSKFLKEGKISFEKRGVILGSMLAKDLKIRLGSKIIFSTQDAHGEINAIALRVRGIVQTTNIELDQSALYVDFKKVTRFLGVKEKSATQIALRSDAPDIAQRLKQTYTHLDVKSFLELYPILKQMEDMMIIFNSITFSIVMLVVFIGILGVMYVSILDRIREFGIMRGIGMAYRHIRLQIFLEALFVGLMGYLLGAVLGYLGLLYLKTEGLNFSQWADGMEAFGFEAIIYAQIKAVYFISTFLAIISASLLSVLFPLRKIKHLNPIDVIKAET